ncbi:pyruvate decarboxylase (PDC6) (PDC3) [Scheffersomyces stipitis CBS 6054]|uniref:Pyruvate decarboxylase (PDC6) (PDC3) n=1 Tax=Scheffersomyces stipitis (strain ATCC 58785 / CBS 6054 / NBRC 10063 / NRRL Y-11545) TaxID=322104 RepID=A3LXV3_PICST|nr:pyruvate decarboxylase (PDC6) (PDC3) [Scheffersomyces stipitis CBS 6054]ABN67867.1 pyruvate decarboxylase (PDC6) (PDC3) [Scheffersomyces stipitis CBS 6054]
MTPVQETIRLPGTSSPTVPENVTLGEYLFLRISQANPKLRSIFGIPGDFNVDLLEHLYSPVVAGRDIKFIGLCNELNGAYTADGYSRAIGGLSTFISTFGVGELSAINGIAGSFAEFSPVLHIVGTTSLPQRDHAINGSDVRNHHHLIQNKNPLCQPNHDVYKKMIEPISVIQESLDSDLQRNMEKIDRVLVKILQESRPGYLFIPCDITNLIVPSYRLYETPLPLEIQLTTSGVEVLEDVVDAILFRLYKSKNPSLLSDCLTTRFNLQDKLNTLVAKLPSNFVKLFSTNMARNIDESLSNFVGLYFGIGSSSKEVSRQLERNTDFLINLGYFNAETTTAGYSNDFSNIEEYIEINPDYIKVNEHIINIKNPESGKRLFSMGQLLDALLFKLDLNKIENINNNNISYKFFPPTLYEQDNNTDYIPQTKLVDYLNENLQPGDLLVMDTMSFCFALPDIMLPQGVQLLTQNYYGSIGYALPSTFGATMAVNDLGSDRRIILIEGDGAAQMTIQELSSFLKYKEFLPNMPKIFLINNDGYTVERMIKGPTRSYNDINGEWSWTQLLGVFGDKEQKYHSTALLRNVNEFNKYFEFQRQTDNSKLEFIELIAGKYDCPLRFSEMFCKK